MSEWRYEIQCGPEGETNYAWVYSDKEMICTAKTHHAKAIVAALSIPVSNTGENAELVKRLMDICENDDHARGCMGREYDCSCGFDERTFATAKEAATALAKADARIAELELIRDSHSRDTLAALNERDVARYKLDQVVNTVQPMIIRRAETAETLLDEARRALEVFSEHFDAAEAFNNSEGNITDKLDRVVAARQAVIASRATLDRIGK